MRTEYKQVIIPKWLYDDVKEFVSGRSKYVSISAFVREAVIEKLEREKGE